MKKELVKTGDGSHSIYLEELNEHYHSHHGAIQEAKHVFIQYGLSSLTNQSQIKVFEVGFGTGLNAFLTLLYTLDNKKSIEYTGIELYPLEQNLIKDLNYLKELKAQEHDNLFQKMHEQPWGIMNRITPTFSLKKVNDSILDTLLPEKEYNLVFYDAFGPRAQKEMWDIGIFQKLYNSMVQESVLVTYCAMGQLKRDLKACGFEVETLPGPPGKREMTRAIKK